MAKQPIRIAGCSGSSSDRRHALASFARNHATDPVDVIVGDWMSEANMTTRGASKGDGNVPAYEHTFLQALEPALDDIARHKIKVAVNAGASDTEGLYQAVMKLVDEKRLPLNVAWISGDEVLSAVQKAAADGSTEFRNVHTGETLAEWRHKPLYAQAYLGGLGIASALSAGADIVVCGRVSDASPIIGASAWWHGWQRTQLDCLANALVAGHLIECSNYVCGGNFSGFKDLEILGWDDIGYPIAEIAHDGATVITKQRGTGGEVSVGTCTAQILYEIQGPWYFNSDVTANLDNVSFELLEADRVALRGVQGNLPPPTTKVGITAHGGYQAEMHYFLVGLDIEEKARMLEAQVRKCLAPFSANYSLLAFTVNGSAATNPTSQSAATVDFRILAQAPNAEDLSPRRFARPCMGTIMQAYPGGTPHFDLRTAIPRPIQEYFVSLLPQSAITHTVHLPFRSASEGAILAIDAPPQTLIYPARQPSVPTTAAPTTNLRAAGGFDDAAGGWAELPAQPGRNALREVFGRWGRTVRGPLGWLVHGRSGDKGSDCNVGLWVRHAEEFDWLRHTLSTAKMKELLGDEYDVVLAKDVDRYEFKGLYAVHFLLRDHLDRGVSCTSSYDFLGKNVAEFIRARWVDLPSKFLDRGKL